MTSLALRISLAERRLCSMRSNAVWKRRDSLRATAIAPSPALARALARFQIEWTPVDRSESALILKNGAPSDAKPASTFAEGAPPRFSETRRIPPQASQQEIESVAARLPVAALGLASRAQDLLLRAGLRHVGDLLERPRAPIAARFGAETLARLDALICRIRDPISPRFEAPDFMSERRFPDGLTRTADIEATLASLTRDLCLLLERHGVGLRRMKASFYRVDGVAKHIEAGTSRPLRDPARLAALLNERLAVLCEDGLDTGYGFDVLRLGATVVERLDPPQTTLAPIEGARATQQDLSDLIDKLGARLGLRRILRFYPQELAYSGIRHRRHSSFFIAAEDWRDVCAATPMRLFGHCACSSGPSRSKPLRLRPMGRPYGFAGGARCMKLRPLKVPNASRRNGGSRKKEC